MMTNNPLRPDPEIDPRLKARLDQLKPVPPRDPFAMEQGRARFMAELDEAFTAEKRPLLARLAAWFSGGQPFTRPKFSLSGALVAALVFLVFFSGAGLTTYAAQSSLPGEALYPLKTNVEQAQASLAADAASRARLQLEFAQRRLDEIAALIGQGRAAAVETAAVQFLQHVERAVQEARLLAASDPIAAAQLEADLRAAFTRFSVTLSAMLGGAPADARPPLQRALQAVVQAAQLPVTPAGQEAPANQNANGSTNGNANLNDNGNLNEEPNANLNGNANANGNGNGNDNGNESGELVTFIGVVEVISPETWLVAGMELRITPQTVVDGAIQVGDTVNVEAVAAPDGSLVAVRIALGAGGLPGQNGNDANQNNANDDNSNDDANDNGNINGGNDNDNDDNDNNDNGGSGGGGGNDDGNDNDNDDGNDDDNDG